MNGKDCPKCDFKETHWLSTTNEWEFYCPECDMRFNKDGNILTKCDVCGIEIVITVEDLPLCKKCELTARAHARLEKEAKEQDCD